MIILFLLPFLLIISSLWAYYSLRKALKKQNEKAERLRFEGRKSELKHGEEVVLFKLED